MFKKLFSDKSSVLKYIHPDFEYTEPDDAKCFDDFYHRYLGTGFEKQLMFSEFLPDGTFSIDCSTGKVRFGQSELDFQMLGSYSYQDESWLWAWANEQSGFNEDILENAYMLKSIGDEDELPELSEAHIKNVSEDFYHKIGIAALGFCDSPAYYPADNGETVVLIAIGYNNLPIINVRDLNPILTVFPQLINAVDIDNHKNIFKHYLIERGLHIRQTDNLVQGLYEGSKEIVTGEFDDLNRLTSLRID